MIASNKKGVVSWTFYMVMGIIIMMVILMVILGGKDFISSAVKAINDALSGLNLFGG